MVGLVFEVGVVVGVVVFGAGVVEVVVGVVAVFGFVLFGAFMVVSQGVGRFLMALRKEQSTRFGT